MDNLDFEIKTIEELVDDFVASKELFRLNYHENNTSAQQVFIDIKKNDGGGKDSYTVKKLLQDLVTHFIVNNYIGSNENILSIFKIVVVLFQKMIENYLLNTQNFMKQTYNYDVNKNTIRIVPKGGMVLKMIFDAYNTGNVEANDHIAKTYSKYFEKSDLDFSLHIDINMPDALFDIVFNDVTTLSYYILYIVREKIEKQPQKYFNYDEYSDDKKIELLRIVKHKLNKNLSKLCNIRCCKIRHNNLVYEDPCVLNLETVNQAKSYDSLIFKLDDGNISTKFPIRFGRDGAYNKTINDRIYISVNESIEANDDGNITKFNLTRCKINFNVQIIEKPPSEDNIIVIRNQNGKIKKIGGELIDVSIPHKTDKTYIMHSNSILRSYIIPSINIEFQSFDTFKIMDEICEILFSQPQPIFIQPKFEKRFGRLFAFLVAETGIIIQNYTKNNISRTLIALLRNIIQNYNNFYPYIDTTKRNKQYIFQNSIDEVIETLRNDRLDNPNIIHILEIYKIIFTHISLTHDFMKNLIAPPETTQKYILFFTQTGEHFEKILQFIDLFGTQNRIINPEIIPINLIGGTCRDERSNINLFLYKSIHTKLLSIFSNYLKNSIDTTLEDLFFQAYDYLNDIFQNNVPINQKFIDENGETIYDYQTDTSNTDILYNYSEQVVALAYLNYLVEYHIFLITYQNVDNNTLNDTNKNTFITNWKGYGIKKYIYKEDVGSNIIKLLNSFTNELQYVYRRLIMKLIVDLSTELSQKYDKNITITEIRMCIIEHKHNEIDKFTRENELDFIYHNWKSRLMAYIDIKYPELNIGDHQNDIRATIDAIMTKSILYFSNNNEGYNYEVNGCGFFSWMHMEPRENPNMAKRYSNCISSTIIETYMFVRLYSRPDNVMIVVECHNNRPHIYWKTTQKFAGFNTSHWASGIVRIEEVGPPKLFVLRHIDEFPDNHIINYHEKRKVLCLLTLPLCDIALQIITSNPTLNDPYKVTKILNIVHKLSGDNTLIYT